SVPINLRTSRRSDAGLSRLAATQGWKFSSPYGLLTLSQPKDMTMRYDRSLFAACISVCLAAATFINDVFWTPLVGAVAFLWPSWVVDPRESVALDRVAHQAMADEPLESAKARAEAFRNRAL